MIRHLTADLVLINGTVISMIEGARPYEALAAKDGRILALGDTEEIRGFVDHGTKVYDVGEKTVLPGFVESHLHPFQTGTMLAFEVNLAEAKSINDIVRWLRRKADRTPKGAWIRGYHYDDFRLKERRHPNRHDLDNVSTAHPIYITRLDGHLAVANSEALRLANITSTSPDPNGGRIERDPESGDITGLLRETAQAAVKAVIPGYSVEQAKRGILESCQQLAKWGITSFVDGGVSHSGFAAYQELVREQKFPLRAGILIYWYPTYTFPGYGAELTKIGIKAGFGNDRLKIIGTKFISDGSMSGRTAVLHEPYLDESTNYGIMNIPEEELKQGIVNAHLAGLRPCIHAVGDKAIDVALDAIELANERKKVKSSRLRIEHCTLPTAKALGRIKELGVVPASSIGFLYELGSAHLSAIGPERIRRYLPHKTYIDTGIVSSGNSDWFVTSGNVMQQIYCAVTRRDSLGQIICEEEKISLMEALKLFTINGAYSSFEENLKGTLEPGKLADIVVLDRNILKTPDEDLKDVRCIMTVVGGEIVYRAEA